MTSAGCLRFTLSFFVAMTPARALADAPAPPPPGSGSPSGREATSAPDDGLAPPRPRPHLLLGLEGGYAVQSLYNVSISGMGFSAAVGATWAIFSIAGIFTFERGWTQEGLQTTNVDAGLLLEHRIDRVKVGGGLRVGTFDVSRVTGTSPLLSTSAGGFFRVSCDLTTFGKDDRSAVYVLGQASIDSVDAPLYGANFALGLRL